MHAQYFPVQSIKNMGAKLEMRTVAEAKTFEVGGARVTAQANPHGPTPALAFRIEDAGKVLCYASDAGYGPEGPPATSLELCRNADLLIHDSTFSPEDRATHLDRGLASVHEAVDCALQAAVKRLALFHYDQDYTDHGVDQLIARARRRLDEKDGRNIEVL